jgi:membrane protease YdiL (CAAX protease family)
MQLPENPGRDFPFYNGQPISLSGGQWLLLLGLVAGSFALLIAPIAWPGGAFGAFVPAILFPLIPLVGLSLVSRGNARLLFGPVGWREIRSMILFALLNIAVSMSVGGIVKLTLGATANQAIATANSLAPGELALFLSKTAVQLVGEEVLTILPLLALLQWLSVRNGMGRATNVFLAWLITAALFGAAHLPTYDWNWVQCLLVIGTARLVLSLAYIKTKNLWVSSGAHILNDWLLILMNVAGAKLLHP